MSTLKRTHVCGSLTAKSSGDSVVVSGWIHRVRDLGGLWFADVRDRSGLVQIFADPEVIADLALFKPESCVCVSGRVALRDEKNKNSELPTGDIEIIADSIELVTSAKPLPFPVSDEEAMGQVSEDLRVKHRYLDLRRPSMFRRLQMRSRANSLIRNTLESYGFVEVETPIITKSTPEGARDYLVAYRQEPGMWYALPQSPQQYKQMLMVAGVERYFQIARCFRDESSRADRQPEFTQLDLEVSFMSQEEILQLNESLLRSVVDTLILEFGLEKQPIGEIPRMTYAEALDRFGCDKPDIRFGLELATVDDIVQGSDFSVFNSVLESGGTVRAVCYPGGALLSRKEIGVLEDFCKEFGAKGMANMAFAAEGEGVPLSDGVIAKGGISKFFSVSVLESVRTRLGANTGDLVCFVAGDPQMVNNVLYRLRLEIGDRCNLRDPSVLSYLWVVDFPLFEKDNAGNWSSMHHPFTMPKMEDLHLLDSDPGAVRADTYDLVCNGSEAAGGSMRIFDPVVQAKVFTLLGISAETQQERFGHILEAFSFGPPPHGGIAWGLDRLMMLLTDTENIREVIAFPKIGPGHDPMMDAPSTIDAQQWAELGLKRS